jgi:predicted ATP-grasp superfamily ATP-dependent carboligase
VESVTNNDVTEAGIRFLKLIGYRGIVELEYKKHAATGSYMFIEANARTSFIGELSVAAGVDIPYIAYNDIAYGKRSVATPALGSKTYTLLNLETDIGSFARYRSRGELTLKQWIGSFFGKKIVHTYFAADDLKPFVRVYERLARRVTRKLLKRITI